MNPKRLLSITRAGIMESLHFRLGIFVTLFANLIYLVLVYYLWKAIYDSSGTAACHPVPFRYAACHVVQFVLTFIPTFIAVMIVTKGAIPMGLNLVWFLIATVFALIINYNIEMLVAPICLFTESTWGINIVKETIVLLLSGASIPLAFFPEKARMIVSYLPFRAVYDIPLSILLGKSGSDSWQGLLQLFGLQLIWLVVLTVAGN